MYSIDNILIDEDIISSCFACNLDKCNGACCTFPGEFGAPLLDSEIGIIDKSLDNAKEFLDNRSIQIINDEGFFEGEKGSYTTMCIDKKDCVFVYYQGKIAKCALEKAYFEGKSEFRKPLSCHLFPIRIAKFGSDYLYYEKIGECASAIDSGNEAKVRLYEFLKEPIVRAKGESWYLKLVEFAGDKL